MAEARPEPAASSESARTRHETLYIDEGGLKTFAVENTLFRVHTYFLIEHSAVLRDMLSIGKADGGEGASDDHPIVLPGQVKAADFELMLSLFYTPAFGRVTSVFEREDLDTCLSLLKLLEFLQMTRCRQAGVQAMRERSLEPIDKVYLLSQASADFDKPWACKAMTALCMKSATPRLSVPEAQRIGWELFVLIVSVREAAISFEQQDNEYWVRRRLGEQDPEFLR
ncbi:hypothetical protein BD626DRAFT_574274 [Schizophyllum amplum]|uniref:BTB domain-containing protein n=1 Tax=Schizophyllum amplum TaxID=97359 RepID=A0A550BYU1_9AGAR|nr:hypothetical protein BD626DRAFT_574274 [Auriculariopsis ampla]